MRYNKIQINDINHKTGQVYLNEKEPGLFYNKGIDINSETGRMKIARSLSNHKFTGYSPDGEELMNLICQHTVANVTYTYALVFNDAGGAAGAELHRATGAVYTLKKNFTSTYGGVCYLFSFLNLIVCQLQKGAVKVLNYSSDGGTTFTEVAWAHNQILKHTVDENGVLYVTTLDKKILKSVDGITFTLVLTDATCIFPDIAYLDGFVYLIRAIYGSYKSYLCRLNADGTLKVLKDFWNEDTYPVIRTQNMNRLLIAFLVTPTTTKIFEWTKSEFKYISTIIHASTTKTPKFFCDNYSAVYLVIAKNLIYKITEQNGIFLLYDSTDFVANIEIYAGSIKETSVFDGSLRLFGFTGAGDVYVYTQDDATTLVTAVAQTPIIDIGEHAPAYLVLKFPPQLATTTITVKAKKNKESTFATTVLTSHTTGRIRETIALKTLLASKLNYIQFEITMADTAGAITGPQEIEFMYLYTPTGVENSI